MTGRIARVFLPKGFGFIVAEDQREYFFHCRHLLRIPWDGGKVKEGMTVNFEPKEDGKRGNGLYAEAVEIVA